MLKNYDWRQHPNVTWVWIHIPLLSEHKPLLWSAGSVYAELVASVVVIASVFVDIAVVCGVVYAVFASVVGFVDGHEGQSGSNKIKVALTIPSYQHQ